MRQIEIPDDVLNKLAAELIKIFGGEKVYSSQVIMHIKSAGSDKAISWIANTKEECYHSLGDYNVLIEFSEGPILFVNHGSCFVNQMLARKFGGCIYGHDYWILYNEPVSVYARYGYKTKLPTSEEVIKFIETLYN
jgi:hypothetical protein